MTEITIHGRGGQGGVTLAKLIATAGFLGGRYAQAFGVYAAERSGAPVQAYVRTDDREITDHSQIVHPGHVIVLDRTLIRPNVAAGAKAEGWLILNTPDPPERFASIFPGRNVATVDATAIAIANGLGSRAVPIVNTTLFGATARVLGIEPDAMARTIAHLHFAEPNVRAARAAYESVQQQHLPGEPACVEPAAVPAAVGLLDEEVGGKPRIQTGAWASRRPQRHTLTPPCNHGCPAGNDVRAFVAAVAEGAYTSALDILLETSPLPGVCGRVCPGPCMDACNRGQHDQSVNVRELERHVADFGQRPEPTTPWRPEHVAVVGSGPAGLSAAYHLARLGYPVTLHEAGAELGGVLRTGIPAYRLPRHILDHEIDYILRFGVDVRTGTRVDRARLLELCQQYAAVFVATGLQERHTLRLADNGDALAGVVIEGLEFLDRVRQGAFDARGQDVIVVGGGNTAMDAARSALRAHARSVRVVYRRSRQEMPAIAEEIDEALEEGVALDELVSPLRLWRDRVGPLLTCRRMRLGEPDESGRRAPVPETSEDACFDLRCDLVVLALGQAADLSILPEGSDVRERRGLLGLTAAPIFTGGDFATNDGTVAAAIGSGRRAAWHIHRTLAGEDLFPPAPTEVAGPEVMHFHTFAHAPRMQGASLEPAARRRTFFEVRQGLVDAPGWPEPVWEARRCLSCGVCNCCDTCIEHCPEGVLVRVGSEYRFDYDYCKGCGVCATQCPRGVIYMAEL